jgi:DNA-directed RNA polymerase subunit RPC12/RpoP
MALIACPECGSDVSDRAPTCPRCGVPILVESKLIVSAPTQQMLFSPKVRIFLDGTAVGEVRKGETQSVTITADGTVSFEAAGRSARLPVQAGRVTRIQLSWNRISGGLVAQTVDTFTASPI